MAYTPPKISDFFINYIQNRYNFYENIQIKLPFEFFRSRFLSAIANYANSQEIVHSLRNNSNDSIDLELLTAYGLNDFMKKTSEGRAYSQLAISVEDALFRAINIEETGLVFMQLLVEHNPNLHDLLIQHLEANKLSLKNLKRFEDELRYGRLNLLN